MILGFDRQFAPKILGGTKKHTIREDKHRRWHRARMIHFCSGMRTKDYEQFYEHICESVQEIEIKYIDSRGGVEIKIDGELYGMWHRFTPEKSVNPLNVVKLITNDGFDDITDFLAWFKRDFKGVIIHWTDLRY